jgi:hypothetical protein
VSEFGDNLLGIIVGLSIVVAVFGVVVWIVMWNKD